MYNTFKTMETQNPVTFVPPEIWIKIFELLNPLLPDYSQNSCSNDILNCNHVCVAFYNILKPTFTSWIFPQVLPFIHPHITNNSIKPILNCRLVCKAWKQGVDHFLEKHHIFTYNQLQQSKLHTDYWKTLSSPNKSIPMTCLFTKQDITTFLRHMTSGNGNPFIGNSLLIRYNPLDNQTGTSYISISSLRKLLLRFGRFVKVLYLYILQYKHWETCPYEKYYGQIRNILELTSNLRRLCIQGYTYVYFYPGENIKIENLNDIVDREVEPLNLQDLESVDIDIGGQHCLSLKLAIQIGICSSLFSQLRRLSLSSNLYTNFYSQSKTDQEKWLRASKCLPNLEQLEVRILAISNLLEVFHLASESNKLRSLTIIISTHSWKDHVKYFSKYYPYNVEPFYRSLCADEHKREHHYFLNYPLDLGDLLKLVQKQFGKSLETLVIFVEQVARKHCKVNQLDVDYLGEMPRLRNLHIEGFPLYKLEIVSKLSYTLKCLVLSGFLRALHFEDEEEKNELKMRPGVSKDLKDGWTIYQSELWETLPGLRWVSAVLWDYDEHEDKVYIYRREKREWLITRNKEEIEEESYQVEETRSNGNKLCCSVV